MTDNTCKNLKNARNLKTNPGNIKKRFHLKILTKNTNQKHRQKCYTGKKSILAKNECNGALAEQPYLDPNPDHKPKLNHNPNNNPNFNRKPNTNPKLNPNPDLNCNST